MPEMDQGCTRACRCTKPYAGSDSEYPMAMCAMMDCGNVWGSATGDNCKPVFSGADSCCPDEARCDDQLTGRSTCRCETEQTLLS